MQFDAPAKEYTDVRYSCRLCPYVSSKSMYLISHYTKAHGMETPDLFERYKSLQCKKCNKVKSFGSHGSLSIHYTAFHRTHFKMDFEVLDDSSKRSGGGGYACLHCSLKLKTTKELCGHLDSHRELKTKAAKKTSSVTASVQVSHVF